MKSYFILHIYSIIINLIYKMFKFPLSPVQEILKKIDNRVRNLDFLYLRISLN